MKFLAAALVLLLVGFASASVQIGNPEFAEGQTHLYKAWMNISSEVLGMSPQVSKYVVTYDALIYRPKKSDEGDEDHEIRISIINPMVSNSLAGVGSKTEAVEMKPDKELEKHLKIPFIATSKNGKFKIGDMGPSENVLSKTIKETTVRHFQLYLDKDVLMSNGPSNSFPKTYSVIRKSPTGNYSSDYIITSSPYTDFPKEHNVVNITRTDRYDNISYPAYYTHHNFEKQGCPGVCKKGHDEDEHSTGCPPQWETYQTPMKRSFFQQHNLRVKNHKLFYDSIYTTERHVANVPDQNMQVTIETGIRFEGFSDTPVPEPNDQTTLRNLKEWRGEASEEVINKYCKYTTRKEALDIAKKVLEEIVDILHKGSIEGESKDIGKKLVLLQEVLALFKHEDFDTFQKDIVPYEEISDASEKDKIKRKIWLDMLPLVGTGDAVLHICHIIKSSVHEKHQEVISLWESKEMLEALPHNIHHPNSEIIKALYELIYLIKDRSASGYMLFFSATHLTLARVIRRACYVNNGIPPRDDNKPNYLQQLIREKDDDNNSECPKPFVKKFVQDIFANLKENERSEKPDNAKRMIYGACLAQSGSPRALEILISYVRGHMEGVTPSYRDYVRLAFIYALQNLVEQHQYRLKEILFPIFTNTTEPPKIRIAAFNVLINCQPSIGQLQMIADQSWREPSEEVCSYVTTALETIGNSTIPCDQLIAQRIKKVISQVKRCAIGKQHAQYNLKTIFDVVRSSGLEYVSEILPSNESFVPSAFYHSLGYHAGTFKDSLQWAFTSQGFNSYNMYDSVLKFFQLKPAENIPKSKEREIFKETEIADRANEFWRFIVYEKIFYSKSYYYMDDEEYQRGDLLSLIKQQLSNIVTKERDGTVKVNLVKVWLPASYQSKAFAKTMPVPVQFSGNSPLVINLKLVIVPKEGGLSIQVNPTVYHSTTHSNKILNLGDCKHVGVYHEKVVALTYPFKVDLTVKDGQTIFAYSFQGLQTQNKQKIYGYHSKAETFKQPHKLGQSSLTERKTIKTIPKPFVTNVTFGFPGFPLFEKHYSTEDISYEHKKIPQNFAEAVQQFNEDYRNPSWKQNKFSIYRKADEQTWKKDSEVRITMEHNHTFVKSKEVKHEDDWVSAIKFDNQREEKDFSDQERIVENKVSQLSHLNDVLKCAAVYGSNTVHCVLEHNRTLEGDLHSYAFRCNVTASTITYKVLFKGVSLYSGRSDVFEYPSQGSQKALMFSSLHLDEKIMMAAKLILDHKPLEEHLNKELQQPVPSKYFKPETHEQCLQDREIGKSQSVNCQKAIQESAIYNHVNFKLLYSQDLSREMEDVSTKFGRAAFYAYAPYLAIEKTESRKNEVTLNAYYINKLTNRPVIDLKITKPGEVYEGRKIPTSILPSSSIDSAPVVFIRHHTNNTYPATCTLSENFVTTYDLKDIALPEDKACSYILTSHCVRHKKFAVIVKFHGKANDTRDLHIYVGLHTLVVKQSSENKFEIEFDGKHYSVHYLHPIMLHETEKIYVVVIKSAEGNKYVEIHAGKAGIAVTYDGKFIKTQADLRYKGELCGLCSEFNGERVLEMRGPRKCLYSHVDDYTTSCALGSCYSPKATHKSICNNNDYDHTEIGDDDEDERPDNTGYEPNLKRNIVFRRGNEVCFSVKCHPQCNPQHAPKQVKIEEIGMHCLPKNGINTKKLILESRRRCLGEMEPKEEDKVEKAEIPTKCS